METPVTRLFEIRFPVVQGGMIWCSGWELASAVSNAGGLGLIGSGSMDPETLRQHIRKASAATSYPFGVNVPLIYRHAGDNIRVAIEEKVPVVFTSAGNPATYTPVLKEQGMTVVHVVSNLKFALKAQEAGVDAIVGEGFEAGGHNGREETTTLVLIPWLRRHIRIPLIAAGGISSGASLLAALSLGADGVQMGSRFAASAEASCNAAFKEAIIAAGEGSTRLMMKKLVPVRLLDNPFARNIAAMEEHGSTEEELQSYLGTGRARKGMFEGNLEEGELEIGQVSLQFGRVKTVAEIFRDLMEEYQTAYNRMIQLNRNTET